MEIGIIFPGDTKYHRNLDNWLHARGDHDWKKTSLQPDFLGNSTIPELQKPMYMDITRQRQI